MGSKNQVTLTFAGDADKLDKTFDQIGAGAKSMGKDIDKSSREAGAGLDRAGEAADTFDTRWMGVADGVNGTRDVWQAWNDETMSSQERMATMAMGMADLGSAVANTVAPLAKTVATHVAGYATMAASAVGSAATQVGAWIMLGVQSLASAAQVALAWLISMGPIILVIAAVIGLAVLIIKNWDTIKQWTIKIFTAVWGFIKQAFEVVKNVFLTYVGFYVAIYKGIWHGIKWVWDTAFGFVSSTLGKIGGKISSAVETAKNIVRGVPDAIKGIIGGVANIITAPFKTGFAGIRSAWNSTVGGKGFTVPNWIPGVGGKSFKIPALADGGIVTGPTIALVGEGKGHEAIIPLDRMNEFGGGDTTIRLESGGSRLDDLLLELLRKAISVQGGNVQVVLGR